MVVSVEVAVCACVGGPLGARMLGPLPAGQVCHGAGGARGGPVLLLPGWLPAVDATRGVRGCGLPVSLGAGSLCGCAVPGGCSG